MRQHSFTFMMERFFLFKTKVHVMDVSLLKMSFTHKNRNLICSDERDVVGGDEENAIKIY